MEAPLSILAGSAHDLDARSPAIQWTPERRAPVQPERSCRHHRTFSLAHRLGNIDESVKGCFCGRARTCALQFGTAPRDSRCSDGRRCARVRTRG